MKIFNWFKKDSRTTQAIVMTKTGQAVGLDRNYNGFSKDGYQRNVVCFKAINGIAGALSQIPICVYQKPTGRTSKKIEITEGPLVDLIKRPNPVESKSDFFRRATSFFLLTGNSFIESVRVNNDLRTPVGELYSLRSDRMQVIAGAKTLAGGYVYSVGGNKVTYPVDQINNQSPILHMKTFHPTNDWYGLSPIEPAAFGVDTHNESNVWNFNLLRNQANPSGVFIVQVNAANPSGALDPNQRANIEKELKQHFQGSKNVGRPMFFEGGVDWKPMSLSPQDMSWMESKNISAREICWGFGYPPILLGLPGDTTFNNVREAKFWLYEESVIPLLQFILDHMNRWLVPAFGENLYLEMNLDEVEALAEKREKKWDKVNTSTFLTINERREAVGYEPVPEGGDVIPVSSSMVPHTFMSEEPEEPAEPDESDYIEEDEEDPEIEEEDEKNLSPEKKNLKIKFDDFAQRWASTKAASRVTSVANVSKKKVKDTIRISLVDWQKDGSNLDNLAGTIRDGLSTKYSQFEKSRSFTIARTESASAANQGSLGAMRAAGIPNTWKEWLASSDDRSRDFHMAVDGMKVPLDAHFEVPNPYGTPDQMTGPGDPQAPAEQIISCRCTLVYEIADDEKSINVRNKRAYQRTFERRLRAHERRFKIQLSQYFAAEFQEISRSISGMKDAKQFDNVVINVIEGNQKKLESIFKSNYETILKEFGTSVLSQID